MSFKSSNWYSLNQKSLTDSFVDANGKSLWSSCKSSGYPRSHSKMKPLGLSSVVSRIVCRFVLVSVSKFPRGCGKFFMIHSYKLFASVFTPKLCFLYGLNLLKRYEILASRSSFASQKPHLLASSSPQNLKGLFLWVIRVQVHNFTGMQHLQDLVPKNIEHNLTHMFEIIEYGFF